MSQIFIHISITRVGFAAAVCTCNRESGGLLERWIFLAGAASPLGHVQMAIFYLWLFWPPHKNKSMELYFQIDSLSNSPFESNTWFCFGSF